GDGETAMREGLALWNEMHYRLFAPLTGTLLAECEAEAGRAEVGLATLDDGALDLDGVAHIDRADLHSERQRHRLDDAELGDCRRICGITKDCHTRYIRSDLFEQLQPLPTHAVFGNHETGDVATRSRQTADDAGADWIADDRKDDRHAAGKE